jgi:hypothetical protein
MANGFVNRRRNRSDRLTSWLESELWMLFPIMMGILGAFIVIYVVTLFFPHTALAYWADGVMETVVRSLCSMYRR